MTSSNDETIEESFDRTIGDWSDFERRPLLKALGMGATLSLGGSAVASAHDDEDDDDHGDDAADDDATDEEDDAEIDPEYGYPTSDVTTIPAELEPDHEVELLIAPPSGPGQPPLFYFDPVGLQIEPGDIVQFTAVTPDHTITAYHRGIGFQQRVPEEAPAFSSPVLGPGGAWLYRFESEGVYDMYCAPHHVIGMVMRLVVGDLTEEDRPEYVDNVEGVPSKEELTMVLNGTSEQNEDCEWPFVMPAEVFQTDALDPMNIGAESEVSFETVADELGYELQPMEADEGEPADEAGATVQVRDHEEHGEILVGPDEMTLYMFENDVQGAQESSCTEGCAEAWPPLTVDGMASAGEGVEAELTTFEREDGGMQVAADGWPLYYFAQDESPGDVNGQGVNDVRWILRPDGTPMKPE